MIVVRNRQRCAHARGFSLAEILISVALFTLIWIALVGTIVMGKASETRSRHRTQAIFEAQKTIEWLRKQPYATLTTALAIPNPVTIDPRGTDDTSDDLMGTQAVAFTSYTAAPICMTVSIYTRVIVRIRWVEALPVGGRIALTETLGTYIARDTQVN